MARHGPANLLLWFISVITKAFLNTQMARYTPDVEESIFARFMHIRPGAAFQGWTLALLHGAETSWPGCWAAPPERDLLLLTVFAAYSGVGGTLNATLTQRPGARASPWPAPRRPSRP